MTDATTAAMTAEITAAITVEMTAATIVSIAVAMAAEELACLSRPKGIAFNFAHAWY